MSKPALTVEALADWLRKQPGETTYDYHDLDDCLLCRYLTAVGVAYRGVGGTYWTDSAGIDRDLNHEFALMLSTEPYTYSAALARAESILAEGRE